MRRERQSGLCAVQRLDLTLLIGEQDDRVFWRIKVETHDSVQFLRELVEENARAPIAPALPVPVYPAPLVEQHASNRPSNRNDDAGAITVTISDVQH